MAALVRRLLRARRAPPGHKLKTSSTPFTWEIHGDCCACMAMEPCQNFLACPRCRLRARHCRRRASYCINSYKVHLRGGWSTRLRGRGAVVRVQHVADAGADAGVVRGRLRARHCRCGAGGGGRRGVPPSHLPGLKAHATCSHTSCKRQASCLWPDVGHNTPAAKVLWASASKATRCAGGNKVEDATQNLAWSVVLLA